MPSKRVDSIKSFNSDGGSFAASDALEMLKKFNSEHGAKFTESIDLSVVLGIDSRKMNVRGSVVLPNSTGKTVSVCCFTDDTEVEDLLAAGVVAGSTDMINSIVTGEIKCDVLLTEKKSMPALGKFGRQLGGKGLMPNPKDGTIADSRADLVEKISEAVKGKVKFRNDKGGIIHVAIGRINLDSAAVLDNIKEVMKVLKKLKPVKAKGKYLKKVYISTTMGPSVLVDSAEFD